MRIQYAHLECAGESGDPQAAPPQAGGANLSVDRELAGVSAKVPGEKVVKLARERPAIAAALDLVFAGV